MVWVRSAQDGDQWHVDPLTVELGNKPNQYLLLPNGDKHQSPQYSETPAQLAARFDKMAMSQPRVTRVAGSVEELWITYAQRSRWMRYPDYISIRFLDSSEGGATFAIFSRSRFGRSDLGVNLARIKIWIKALG